ncbi:MAG: GTP 3',8-cyclase MoaA [Planctomycetota bacterium]|nr:GTP 3',8-cyclase MoaA [Planctomycetota bacterium]
MTAPLDTLGRPLGNLRISVTDRCNLRCAYCMPEEEYRWLPKEHLLRFEEIARLARVFASLGVTKVRLTGGEPLLRHELHELVRQLAAIEAFDDLALTTNGLLLAEQADALADSGLKRITVSLDTLRADTFEALTRRSGLERVLAGIDAASRRWPGRVKLDTVVMRGTNDGEVLALLDFARERGLELRLIEYMDVGGATKWNPQAVVPREELLALIETRHARAEPLPDRERAPAERFRLADGTVFGIIASTTAPFCGACDRARLTADGTWYLCLYARIGLDLRELVRGGKSEAEIAARVRDVWTRRADRGAEVRLEELARGPLVGLETLRRDPHLEMHTRGG